MKSAVIAAIVPIIIPEDLNKFKKVSIDGSSMNAFKSSPIPVNASNTALIVGITYSLIRTLVFSQYGLCRNASAASMNPPNARFLRKSKPFLASSAGFLSILSFISVRPLTILLNKFCCLFFSSSSAPPSGFGAVRFTASVVASPASTRESFVPSRLSVIDRAIFWIVLRVCSD